MRCSSTLTTIYPFTQSRTLPTFNWERLSNKTDSNVHFTPENSMKPRKITTPSKKNCHPSSKPFKNSVLCSLAQKSMFTLITQTSRTDCHHFNHNASSVGKSFSKNSTQPSTASQDPKTLSPIHSVEHPLLQHFLLMLTLTMSTIPMTTTHSYSQTWLKA